MQLAVLERLGPGDERLVVGARAAGHRQLAGVAVDLREGDAFGRVEGRLGRPASADFMNSVQIGSAACVPVRPTGWLSSKPHPDDGEQLGREADEPGVAQIVGRAALAGGVEGEAVGPRARARCPR